MDTACAPGPSSHGCPRAPPTHTQASPRGHPSAAHPPGRSRSRAGLASRSSACSAGRPPSGPWCAPPGVRHHASSHAFLPRPGPGHWQPPCSTQGWHTAGHPTHPSGPAPKLVTVGAEGQSGCPPESKGAGTHSLTWTGKAVRQTREQAPGGHGGRWQGWKAVAALPSPLCGWQRGEAVLWCPLTTAHGGDLWTLRAASPPSPDIHPCSPLRLSRLRPQRARWTLQRSGRSWVGPCSPGVSRCPGPQSPP